MRQAAFLHTLPPVMMPCSPQVQKTEGQLHTCQPRSSFSFKAFLPGNWHRPQLSGTHWKPQSSLIPGAGSLHLHSLPPQGTQGSMSLLPPFTATGLEVTELYKRKGCNFKAMSFVYSITKYIFEDLHTRSHCEDAEVPGVLQRNMGAGCTHSSLRYRVNTGVRTEQTESSFPQSWSLCSQNPNATGAH